MLGLLLMRLLTPPTFDLPAVPSVTWSVTTYTPTASPHHHTFTAWDFSLPTLPLPLLLLLLALLFYALHRHEDRQRRASYEGIFLHPSVPNAKVHIATTTSTATRDEGAPPKRETLNPAPGPRQWHVDDDYTRRPPASFAASTALRQSQPQPHTLPQPPIHSPTQIKLVQWYGTSYAQTYTRPAAATRSVMPPPPASPLIRAPPQLRLPAPQHSSLPMPMPMPIPMPATDIRNHALPPPLQRAPIPHRPYSHPTHATQPTWPNINTARTVSTNNVNHTYRPLHPRPRPAYPQPLYRITTSTTKPSIRQLGRSAVSKPAPLTIDKLRTSIYPRRDPSPVDDDDGHNDVKEESDTDAMDIDLPTPPSTPLPETAVTPTAPSLGSACCPRPRRNRALRPHQREPKKELVRRVHGGRVVKSRDGSGMDWVRGFMAAPVRSRKGERKGGRNRVLKEAGPKRELAVHVRVMALRKEAKGEWVRGRWRGGRRAGV